ncbi:hypothetical protein GCM10017567_19570 [Amycolatopsis bullii]|uniref:Response regulatory domain-containing protein n=1 Tax=Amycolatopsis bullii TaxID=941987 RepID=A0ABQ3K560_9PSEU|nr:hypothetical protein GCM10017567_19570 [Amycolatopsis bullii]
MSGKSVDGKGRAGVRIMIADDEAAIRESLERVLQVEGYDTSTVANGFAVLDGVDADAPDLLILDVMMPSLGRVGDLPAVRAAGRDLPVLMLTARDQVADRVAGLDAGAVPGQPLEVGGDAVGRHADQPRAEDREQITGFRRGPPRFGEVRRRVRLDELPESGDFLDFTD